MLSERDIKIIKVLQEEFPICERPFKLIAMKLEMSEEELLKNIQRLYDEKNKKNRCRIETCKNRI